MSTRRNSASIESKGSNELRLYYINLLFNPLQELRKNSRRTSKAHMVYQTKMHTRSEWGEFFKTSLGFASVISTATALNIPAINDYFTHYSFTIGIASIVVALFLYFADRYANYYRTIESRTQQGTAAWCSLYNNVDQAQNRLIQAYQAVDLSKDDAWNLYLQVAQQKSLLDQSKDSITPDYNAKIKTATDDDTYRDMLRMKNQIINCNNYLGLKLDDSLLPIAINRS